MAAQSAAEVSEVPAAVVETRTVPQGFTSLLAFNPTQSLEENVEAMTASVTHLMIAVAIVARDEELAVKLTATHLAEFYHLKENFPFLLKNTHLL